MYQIKARELKEALTTLDTDAFLHTDKPLLLCLKSRVGPGRIKNKLCLISPSFHFSLPVHDILFSLASPRCITLPLENSWRAQLPQTQQASLIEPL